MHRIDGIGALPGGSWTEGNPLSGIPPTQVTADFMQAVQEEIAGAVLASGLSLDKEDNSQLTRAMSILGAGRRNVLLNGDFTVIQRPQPFGALSYSAPAFVADRWLAHPGGGGTIGVGIQPSLLALNPGAFATNPDALTYLTWSQTVAASGTKPHLRQRIEHVQTLAGGPARLSFAVKVFPSGGLPDPFPFEIQLVQVFGTSGAFSPPVTLTQALPVEVSPIFGNDFQTVEVGFTLPSVLGKFGGPLTSSYHYLELRINLPLALLFSFSISNVQLERGGRTEFERLPLTLQRLLCQRYYETSRTPTFTNTVPGTAFWPEWRGAATGSASGSGATGFWELNTRFRVPKRAVPTVLWRSPETGAPNTIRSGAGDQGVVGTLDACIDATGAPDAPSSNSGRIGAHWEADAEL